MAIRYIHILRLFVDEHGIILDKDCQADELGRVDENRRPPNAMFVNTLNQGRQNWR